MFQGSIVALITPFRDGAVDEKAFQSFVEWQIEQGTHGLVPCGTTGESPTLSHEEHMRVTELCIEAAGGRVPVIAGTGSNSTAEAIALTQHAEKAGADGALLVMPYYNKPTQDGLSAHFRAIHDATDIPLLIYNIPGRSVVNMSIDTMIRLAQLPNIVGVKDATGDPSRISTMRLLVGSGFCQLSGEDAIALSLMAHGGHGCISVTANAAPKLCAEFQNACLADDFVKARKYQDQLMPLHTALFLETSPGPVKHAVSLLDRCADELRLPLVPVGEKIAKQIRIVMRACELLD
ncbi:MAG TPA: 4-hydroxy-tetrahydrodipicolinate synthase [Alphaproteobacteria bacterium]|jgi:4-hydroxy-tetrahydrodipicolinate synthase|nr:4-hydroxy-tetrahydrodipicolinate synthase [Alphaproteobacteria bacterium]